MTLPQVSQLIEASLAGLKMDPAACRGEKPGQWGYSIKDAKVWIDVFDFKEKPGVYYLQVSSPLCAVPDTKLEAFFQDLLEINFSMYGSWMCKRGTWIYVLSLREVEGLDQKELDATLDRVAYYSTDYYGKLSFKYSGCWLPKTDANTGGSVPGPTQ
jgi:hypothetical protein